MFIHPWIKALRPKHWLKNGIIFMPLVFARHWSDPTEIGRVVLATFAFCAVASAGYLVNDVQDREKDRLHPTKKDRPIAAGVISPRAAYGAALVLFAGALLLGYVLALHVMDAFIAYAILMFAYSRGLKRIPIVDLFVIALGFVIRIVVGGAAISVALSGWLIGCTFIVALLLGLGKRIVELQRVQSGETRKTLVFYTRERTIWMERVLSVFTIITYLAYTLSGKHSAWMAISVLPVIYGVYRYSCLLTETHLEGPTEMLTKDRWLQVALLSWVFIVALILRVTDV